MKKTNHILLIFIIVSYIGCLVLSTTISHLRNNLNMQREEGKIESLNDMAYKITETFKMFLASFCWIKAQAYFHGGWELADKEIKKSAMVPYIPEHEHDSNGIYAMLPWYWLTTTLDPTFERAYSNGAYFLAFNLGKVDEAINYLQEGIHNNPDSYTLYYVFGRIYFSKFHDYDVAIQYFKKALTYTIAEEEDEEEVYRFLIFSYQKKGDLNSALETSKIAVKRCPWYKKFKRYVKKYEKQIADEKAGIFIKQDNFIENELKTTGEFFDPHKGHDNEEGHDEHDHHE